MKNPLYNFTDIPQQKFLISQIHSFLLFENHSKLSSFFWFLFSVVSPKFYLKAPSALRGYLA